MSKATARMILCIGCLLVLTSGAVAVELVIPADISATLNRQIGRNYNKYQVEIGESQRIGGAFEDWVGESLDFDVANRTTSTRFGGRESFYQELAKNIPVFMYDRGQAGLVSDKAVPVVYRRGAGRFSFRKLLTVEAKEEVPDGTAVEMAGSFLSKHNFLKQTAMDKIGAVTFPQLRQKSAPVGDTPERDFLLFQEVRYQREFLSAPVINSRISVDYHPETLEVLGFKHYHWTGVSEDEPTWIPREQMKSREDVEAALKGRIGEFWSESEQATLKSTVQGWFQTETELIPILACELVREETGCGETCGMLINLSGSDLVFRATPKLTPGRTQFTDCYPSTHSNYEDWVRLGSPSCWCNPYQCDGDADDAYETKLRYRVYTLDLQALIDNWRKKVEDAQLDPCADFDHKAETALNYRVYTLDLQKLIDNWRKTDRELKGDCPRP